MLYIVFESNGNAAVDKRKLFRMGKGLFVREGVKNITSLIFYSISIVNNWIPAPKVLLVE